MKFLKFGMWGLFGAVAVVSLMDRLEASSAKSREDSRRGLRHRWIGREIDEVLEGCAEEGGNHNERWVA